MAFLLIFSSVSLFAEDKYKMRHNPQTGRGDWVLDAAASGYSTIAGSAEYNFTNNDFNGTGDFTTTGNLTATSLTLTGDGDSEVDGNLTVVGNVSIDGNFIGNGSLLTGISAGYTNLAEFVAQTAWRIFYSDGSGDVKELALGADGEYLKSNGASAIPSWAAPSGAAHDAVTVSNTSTVNLTLSTQALTATVNATWAATKQAADADLTTWAGVTPSANGQSLVAAANYAAMRGLLDLEAGTDFYDMSTANSTFMGAALLKDLVTTAPLTGGTDNILPGADSDVTLALTLTGDVVATAPILINGTTSVDNIIPGADTDYTLSINMLKDLVTTAPLTGGTNDILPGTDSDVTIAMAQANSTTDGYTNMTDYKTSHSKGFFVYNVTDSDDIPLWKAPAAITITAIHAVSTLGNVNFTLGEYDANGANGAVVDSSWIATSTTNANDDGTLSNPSIDSGDWVGIIINNATANATLAGTFEYNY